MKRGRMVYVPPDVLAELESIREQHQIGIKVEAFRKMVQYARVGREVEIIKLGGRKRGGVF